MTAFRHFFACFLNCFSRAQVAGKLCGKQREMRIMEEVEEEKRREAVLDHYPEGAAFRKALILRRQTTTVLWRRNPGQKKMYVVNSFVQHFALDVDRAGIPPDVPECGSEVKQAKKKLLSAFRSRASTAHARKGTGESQKGISPKKHLSIPASLLKPIHTPMPPGGFHCTPTATLSP